MENVEKRFIPNEDSEVRAIPNSRKIEGYGIVFNKESRNLGGFTEIILPEAIDGILERSDVLALLNHDVSKGVLARSTNGKGTLNLSVDKRGVKYSFEAPNFDLGDELVEGVKRGDIKGSSFAFSLAEDEWDYKRKPVPLRTIRKFDAIFDMSPCYREAYQDTTVALRNLEQGLKTDITENVEFKDNTVSSTEIEVKPLPEEPVIELIAERKEEKEVVVEQRNSTNLKLKTMTIIELQDLKAKALEENEKVYEAKAVENRTMTEKEEAQTALNNQKIKEYDLQIETESRKSGPGRVVGPYINFGKEKEPFSLLKAIRAKVEQREVPGVARDIFLMGKNEFREAGVNPMGDIVIPSSVESRANPILAQTATKGMEIIAEDKKSILPPLVDRLVFSQAGATFMTGLTGTVSIPSYAGTAVAWKSEIEASVEDEGLFSEVVFSPLRLTAWMLVSKLFLVQDTVGAERLLLDNIANAVARQLEKTILGPATNLAGSYPQGIGYMINNANATKKTVLTGATITWAKMVGLETSVDTSNALAGNLAYITNSKGRGLLKTIDKGLSNDTGDFILADGTMNGYPVLVTNSIVSTYGTGGDGNAVIFGNWADLCVAQWGGYDITVDPYTAAATNQVKIVINAYFDAKGLRGDGGTTGADLNQYMYSFACESVK